MVQGDFVAKPTANSNGKVAATVSSPPSPASSSSIVTSESRPAAAVAEAAIAPTPSISSAAKPGRGRAPLVLTLVGVIIFIGGVSGLFVYALSGQ